MHLLHRVYAFAICFSLYGMGSCTMSKESCSDHCTTFGGFHLFGYIEFWCFNLFIYFFLSFDATTETNVIFFHFLCKGLGYCRLQTTRVFSFQWVRYCHAGFNLLCFDFITLTPLHGILANSNYCLITASLFL